MWMSLSTLDARKIGTSSSRNSYGAAVCRGTEFSRVVLQRSGSKFVEVPKNISSRCCREDRGEELRFVRGIVVAPRERFISQPFRRARPTLPFRPFRASRLPFCGFELSRFFTPRLILRMNLRENFFRQFRVSPPARRLDTERNCGGKRREAASSYRD